MAHGGDYDNLPELRASPFQEEDDVDILGIDLGTAASFGLAVNEHGGIYKRGMPHDIVTKLSVSAAIKRRGSGFTVSAVAKDCKVSRYFVRKVHEEMLENDGNIIDPRTQKQHRARGAGTYTFTEFDHYVLLFLYLEEPSRTNASYVERLHAITGTVSSTSTVSRWFNHFFPISGRFRKPNLVPIDKFKTQNLWKAEEYLEAIATIAPKRLRFGDEKLIKGAEVYCRRTRLNVLTGEM